MIIIKSEEEIQHMIKSGAILGKAFDHIANYIKPGVSTLTLDKQFEKFLRMQGATPSCKNFEGYPSSICASVNDVLIHGIPSSKVILKEGDIISIDTCDLFEGYQGDATRTFRVGKVSAEANRLIECTEKCFYEALKVAKVGNHLSDISAMISKVSSEYGYSPIKEYGGHGIGRGMHEDPFIFNYGEPGHGPILREGMCLAVEPMIQEGSDAIRNLDDGWGVASEDGKLTCHYENTIYIASDGAHITTIDENVKGHLENVER